MTVMVAVATAVGAVVAALLLLLLLLLLRPQLRLAAAAMARVARVLAGVITAARRAIDEMCADVVGMIRSPS